MSNRSTLLSSTWIRRLMIGAGFLLLYGGVLFSGEPVPGDLAWRAKTGEPVVALSFDDGPGPDTARILEILKKHNAGATFFMLGEQARRKPEWARAVADAGHEIASHTDTHVNYAKANPAEGPAKLRASFRSASDAIEKATGRRPAYVRMPHGIDRAWIRDVAREEGVVLVNWSFGADWNKMSDDDMTKAYVDAAKPGAVLLMHDGGKRGQTAAVLDRMLTELSAKGVKAVPVGELFKRFPAQIVKRS